MFELFEHKADMGIKGIASSQESAFAECAKAMFSVMVELNSVEQKEKVKLDVDAVDLDQLLVEFLNELLYAKDVNEMLFSEFVVKEIKKIKGGYKLHAIALGEKIDEKKHKVKTEVKAASYSQLKVEQRADGKWVAQCIVDV